MGCKFKECDRKRLYLMPPSEREWLPEGGLALFIIDAVSQMDVTPFYLKCRPAGPGEVGFEPSMMVCLLLYAYAIGIRSSRQIEGLCERDIGFKVITANEVPDHTVHLRAFGRRMGRRWSGFSGGL